MIDSIFASVFRMFLVLILHHFCFEHFGYSFQIVGRYFSKRKTSKTQCLKSTRNKTTTMGKAGRIACIFTPFALTIASFICLILIEIAGWNKGLLPSYYFMKVNFTDLDITSVSNLAGIDTTTLTLALQQIENQLADVYEIHLWNYCTSDSTNGTIDYCSKREAEFSFDPVDVWSLNATSTTSGATPTFSNSVIQSAVNTVSGNVESFEDDLLGYGAKDALEAYKKASKAMFILYAVAFWTTLATLVLGILAIFSRWGSLCTWIFASISSIINLAAVGLTTGIFVALVGALKGVLDPYNVSTDLGRRVLVVGWLGVVFSWAATLFWLFSVCCCSGRSNPHHRSNKGGLWNAEPKGMGYGDYGRRSMHAEKNEGEYERDTSPFLGHAENENGDRMPLNSYSPQPAYPGAYEPYRHG